MENVILLIEEWYMYMHQMKHKKNTMNLKNGPQILFLHIKGYIPLVTSTQWRYLGVHPLVTSTQRRYLGVHTISNLHSQSNGGLVRPAPGHISDGVASSSQQQQGQVPLLHVFHTFSMSCHKMNHHMTIKLSSNGITRREIYIHE